MQSEDAQAIFVGASVTNKAGSVLWRSAHLAQIPSNRRACHGGKKIAQVSSVRYF
jgi:hypothetical protein